MCICICFAICGSIYNSIDTWLEYNYQHLAVLASTIQRFIMYNPETGGLVQTQKEFTAIEGIILLQSLVPGYLQNLVSSGFLDINAK